MMPAYPGDRSHIEATRPLSSAEIATVPDPANGSSHLSPGRLFARMKNSGSSGGKTAGWPIFSLLFAILKTFDG